MNTISEFFPSDEYGVILPSLSSYRVTAEGDVLGMKFKRSLVGSLNKYGYQRYTLINDQGKRVYRIRAAMVCQAFRGDRPPGFLVRHLDGSRDNDSPGNLVWGTHKENCADKLTHGTVQRGEKSGNAKITADQARLVKSMAHLPKAEVVRITGIHPSTVSNIRFGGCWRWV